MDYQRLQGKIEGEVLTGIFDRGRYATDASIYQIMPRSIVVPKTWNDVEIALEFAKTEGVPLLARGGGTSQSGQTVNDALVVDFSKHLNKVLSYDPESGTVEVEPGLVLDDQILLLDDGNGGLTIPATEHMADGADTAMAQLIAGCGIKAEPGFIYSVYQDKSRRQHISFLCQAEDGTPANGAFTQIVESTLMDVADPAICTMLERFARESRLGNFGIYYVDETSGQVKPLVRES